MNNFLQIIPGAEALPLPPCNGVRTIAQAKNVFNFIQSPFFQGLTPDLAESPPSCVQVRDVVQDGNLEQMFRSLSRDRDEISVSQRQIILFCEKYSKWIGKDGCTVIFPLKDKEYGFFSVYVLGFSNRLSIFRHNDKATILARSRVRLVSLRLESENL